MLIVPYILRIYYHITKIMRALHGLKFSDTSFRNHLKDYIEHLGFVSYLDDDYVWCRPATKSNGGEYCVASSSGGIAKRCESGKVVTVNNVLRDRGKRG